MLKITCLKIHFLFLLNKVFNIIFLTIKIFRTQLKLLCNISLFIGNLIASYFVKTIRLNRSYFKLLSIFDNNKLKILLF